MATPTPVTQSLSLFRALEAAAIRHCHWKSNEHLQAALAGQTDLDLLVDRERADDVEVVLRGLGFKPFVSPSWARYPGIFDWLGFDSPTGTLLHVHLHHELSSGTQFVKEQVLPFAETMLDTAERDPETGVYIAAPAVELVILLLRSALKTQALTRLGSGHGLSASLSREFVYLFERVDPRRLRQAAVSLLPPDEVEAALSLLSTGRPPDAQSLTLARGLAHRVLDAHRRLSPTVALARSAQLGVARFTARLARKLDLPGQWKKAAIDHGLLVAIIGCDGAGKSTVTLALSRWLSWKADVRTVYLGVGDGEIGVGIRVLRGLAATLRGDRPRASGAGRNTATASPSATPAATPSERVKTRWPVPLVLRETGSGILNITMARERLRKLRRAQRAREAGSILLTDRFPQDQVAGIYDGPRGVLHKDGTAIGRFFFRTEREAYVEMKRLSPDVIIKLHVPVEVAVARKAGHQYEAMRRKVDLTSSLVFPELPVHDVDANRPLEDVVLDCKRIVWSYL